MAANLNFKGKEGEITMLRKITISFFITAVILILLSGCGMYRIKKWSPQVGMTEEELVEHWGESHDCSTYTSRYGAYKKCWYSMEPITGILVGSYTAPTGGPILNMLITIKDGKITSIYTP